MISGRVMLVCDGPWDVPFYRGILSALGYDLVMCRSHEEGARRVETEDFDLRRDGIGVISK